MKHLILVANCFPVKGYKRSIVCDTMRYKYEFIPNSLFDFLKKYNRMSMSSIRADFGDEDWKIIESYLRFLEEKEFIFYSNNPELFPNVEVSWENSNLIANAVIDFDTQSDHDIQKIMEELNDLRCEAIEFRVFNSINSSRIQQILDYTKDSSLRSVYLLSRYHEDHTRLFFEELIKGNRRLMTVTIHSTPADVIDQLNFEDQESFYNISFVKQEINSEAHCGAISKFNFSTSISMFMESHFSNSCLNRKVAIDKNGFIKNCPSSTEIYGSHKTETIKKAVEESSFKKHWDITKDKVLVCSDCEFRYICTDCRVYIEDPQNIFSKPKKCDYDPYAAVWLK